MKLQGFSAKSLLRISAATMLVLFAAAPSAYAVKEYYSIARSPRALGMGNAFYALSDDEYAIFYNPAGLSRYSGTLELMLQTRFDVATKLPSAMSTLSKSSGKSISSIIQSLEEFQGSPLYGGVGFSFPFFARKNFAVSLQLADAKLDMAVLGKDINTIVDLNLISDSGLILGYGDTFFMPGLHLGFNLKGLVRAGGKQSFTVLEIAQGKKVELDPEKIGGVGAGVDFDLGAMYELPRLLPVGKFTTSLTLTNLLGSDMNMVKIAGNNPPGLARMISLGGLAEFPGVGIIDKFNVALDLAEFQIGGEDDPGFGARTGSFWKHVNLGVEVPIRRFFFVRAGFRQGYLTAGLGLDLRFMKLDLATYAEELAELPGRLPSRRVAMRLAFGYSNGHERTVPSATSSGTPDVTPDASPVMPEPTIPPPPPVAPPAEVIPTVPKIESVAPPAKPTSQLRRGKTRMPSSVTSGDRFGLD